MVTAASLKDQMDDKVRQVKDAVFGMSEEQASRAPAEGEWCVKEVLSHLVGYEMDSFKSYVQRVLDEDMPTIDIVPGVAHFDEGRRSMSTEGLLAAFEEEYGQIAGFLAALSEEQLSRKGHVALLKETPLGEYPTLGQLAGALINFHLNDHVQQLRNLAK